MIWFAQGQKDLGQNASVSQACTFTSLESVGYRKVIKVLIACIP